MAWPGRGPGASRGSQAWMFATAEEMLGRRAFRDDTVWASPPTELEAYSREFTTRAWDFATKTESQPNNQNTRNKNVKAAAPPTQVHKTMKAAEKASSQADGHVKKKTHAWRHGQNGHSADKTTVQIADIAPSRIQSKPKGNGKKLQQSKPQAIAALTESSNANDTYNQANEKVLQSEDTIAKNKPKKKEKKMAGTKKMAGSTISPEANVHMDGKVSEASKTVDSPLFTVTEPKSNDKDEFQSPMATSKIIASETMDSTPNTSRSEAMETTNTTASVRECISLFAIVKDTVSKYCMQSPAHFALHIDVQLAESGHQPNHDASRSRLNITFQNYSQNFNWLCKRYFRKGRVTCKVMVCTAKYPVPLQRLLAEHFPVSDIMTSEGTLRQFWNANGKSFNWSDLPTELKEHVIQFCIIMAPKHPDHFHSNTRVDRLSIIDKHSCELVDRLSQWKSLLRVSTQVRAITLRLCHNGSLVFDKGLCMTSYSLPNFSSRISKLEHFSQIAEPDSAPLHPDGSRHLLAVVYRDAPKIYHELKRYGDFSQGVRKIDISFDFISFYRFFKVTAGEFGKDCQPRCTLTYNVFERMPYLNEIIVRLPSDRMKTWVNKTHQMERPLFHITSPCPRMIYRILYERIAEALATYENVSVRNFLSETEEKRFWCLRQTAMKTLRDTPAPEPFKLTVKELQEINMHDRGGGVQLTPNEITEAHRERYERFILQQEKEKIEKQLGSLIHEGPEVEPFYPIRCQCFVPCQERYEFYPSWQ